MTRENVLLVPLEESDREQFILDNQRAFKHAALVERDECGKLDGCSGFDGEIISRKTIETCLDAPESEAYRIMLDGKPVGGAVLRINEQTRRNELELLFVVPEAHSKGVGYRAWKTIEALHPETEVWETCTPYFDKRNIHFYVNKCGFCIDEFWCERFKPSMLCPEEDGASDDPRDGFPDDDPGEMFHFVKVMR